MLKIFKRKSADEKMADKVLAQYLITDNLQTNISVTDLEDGAYAKTFSIFSHVHKWAICRRVHYNADGTVVSEVPSIVVGIGLKSLELNQTHKDKVLRATWWYFFK